MCQISKFNIKTALNEIPNSEYYETFEAFAEKQFHQLFQKKSSEKTRESCGLSFLSRWEIESVYGKVNEISKLYCLLGARVKNPWLQWLKHFFNC